MDILKGIFTGNNNYAENQQTNKDNSVKKNQKSSNEKVKSSKKNSNEKVKSSKKDSNKNVESSKKNSKRNVENADESQKIRNKENNVPETSLLDRLVSSVIESASGEDKEKVNCDDVKASENNGIMDYLEGFQCMMEENEIVKKVTMFAKFLSKAHKSIEFITLGVAALREGPTKIMALIINFAMRHFAKA